MDAMKAAEENQGVSRFYSAQLGFQCHSGKTSSM